MTANEFSPNQSEVWGVDLGTGYAGQHYKTADYLARCVRGGNPGAGIGSFEHLAVTGISEQLVTDYVTGLIWQKSEGGAMRWHEALSYCEGLTYAGESNWRLPNSRELMTLVNYDKHDPSSDFPDISPEGFWSSTTAIRTISEAWGVYLFAGHTNNYDKTRVLSVRCVTGGP